MSAEDAVAIDVDAWQGRACVGVVVDAGERARVLIGKRVLAGTYDACGECDVCRRGGAAVCPRGELRTIADRTTAQARWLVALGDGLELPLPSAAAVAGDVTLAYTAYARTNLAPHDAVVIVGRSAIGRFLVEILRAKGITPTVVTDRADAAWQDWLLARGVAVVRLDAGTDARAAVGATITAQGASTRPWRIIVVEREAVPLGFALAGPRTTLTLIGEVDAIDPGIVAREVGLVGVAREHPDLIVEAAAMCAKGEIDLVAGTTTSAGDPTRSYVAVHRA